MNWEYFSYQSVVNVFFMDAFLGIKKNEKNQMQKDEVKNILKYTQEQNESLKNFAHNLSHNLRSHSSNLEMLITLLIKQKPNLEQNEIVKMLRVTSENLSETIENLKKVILIYSSTDIILENLNLKVHVDKVICDLRAFSKERNVTIQNHINTELCVLCIPDYLQSIIYNFISNGLKFSEENRESFVKLDAFIKDGYVVLCVEDNGLGINLEKYEAKLYELYSTFHENEDSAGIGLFITKNQVEAIGGKIEVESKVNVGTRFKIHFKYEEE